MQLAEQFDVHPNQISTWKDQLLEGAAEVFATSSSARPSTPEVDIKTLHAKIGELTLENDFLKRALDKAGGMRIAPDAQAIFFRRRHQPSKPPPVAKLDVFSVSLEVRLYAER